MRLAGRADAEIIGRLLGQFNREFDEPTPGPAALARRLRQLLAGDDTAVQLGRAQMGRAPEAIPG